MAVPDEFSEGDAFVPKPGWTSAEGYGNTREEAKAAATELISCANGYDIHAVIYGSGHSGDQWRAEVWFTCKPAPTPIA